MHINLLHSNNQDQEVFSAESNCSYVNSKSLLIQVSLVPQSVGFQLNFRAADRMELVYRKVCSQFSNHRCKQKAGVEIMKYYSW
jgi:hypothetical protein